MNAMKAFAGFTIALVAWGCVTDDPRDEIREPLIRADEPSQLGELCGSRTTAGGEVLQFGDCATGVGLTCFENTCTPSEIAAVCTPSPCGDGFCLARGNAPDGGGALEDLAVFCNCDSGELWDANTCIEDTRADFPMDTLPSGQTCPFSLLVDENGDGVQDAGDIPDDTTQDCAEGTFCTENSGGDCIPGIATLDGDVAGNMFTALAVGADAIESDILCQRKYYVDVAMDGERSADDGDGVRITISGPTAGAVISGASEIVVESFRVPFDTTFRVWPRASSDIPWPEADSGFARVTVDGTTVLDAIGGTWDVSSAPGVDEMGNMDDGEPTGDGLIDDGEGRYIAQFHLGFNGGDFLQGTLNIPCGDNIEEGSAPQDFGQACGGDDGACYNEGTDLVCTNNVCEVN
ncbi:MAG: hypothetical protein AAFU77_13905 [Myxococcota bacterium]